ncbi:MAG TPA: hypothetical protein VMX58_12345, partial [Patescibacteria group bacterium]|nr:hypothetical protein [Patescibacteria group bacterium]
GLRIVGGGDARRRCCSEIPSDSSAAALGAGGGPVGTVTEGIGKHADSYCSVARHAVQYAGARGTRMPAVEPGRCSVTVLGEREDFANPVVARFVNGLARLLGTGGWDTPRRDGGMASRSSDGYQGPFSGTMLRPALRYEAPGTREPMEILALEAGRSCGGEAGIVVFLNRRPLLRRACEELCTGSALAVVAGWPYAAHFLPPGKPAIITYGVYDTAVNAVAALITGHPV